MHTNNQAASLANGNQLNIRSWGAGNTNNSVAPTAGGPAPQTGPIGFDFGSNNSTSLAGTATANVIAQNGFTAGILSNLTVGQDGTISGAFTNGQTTTLGRVAVATFQNEGGLQRVGGSDFAATANSGLAQVGTASVGRYGSIVSGSLEQSNVSIADEFTKMISAQNAYQANSKSITTASEDMQTVINLIRYEDEGRFAPRRARGRRTGDRTEVVPFFVSPRGVQPVTVGCSGLRSEPQARTML